MRKFRSKGTSTVVWVLMGFLILGLGGFGVTNFSGGSTTVGKAGDVEITSQQFDRALRDEMQRFSAQTGKPVTGPEARAMGMPQVVLSRLFLLASLESEATHLGVSAGDKSVADQIAAISAFHGVNGKFDANAYRTVLRNEGLTESAFEHDLRMDEARKLLQQAVVSGVKAPSAVVDRSTSWLLETRDIRWQELTVADLPAPVALPDQAALEAWHQANADRFTSPEIREITFAWLTPDMIESKVQVDEQALRDLYQERIDEFQKPERRATQKLVFQDDTAAAEAKARLESGAVDFEALAGERGLTLTDIDLGEVTKTQLGPAGDAVFALAQPGIAGPVETDLGPALFKMDAILEPLNVSFEEARAELLGEAAPDRARRQIEDMRAEIDDLVAGGATPEDLVKQSDMEIGHIDWSATMEPAPGSIAGYPEFRALAAGMQASDFPELHDLEDGGIFIARLDKIVPPALIPFDEVKDRVATDWTAAEVRRQLLALADERKVNAMAEEMEKAPAPGASEPASDPAPETAAPGVGADSAAGDDPAPAPAQQAQGTWHAETGLSRDGQIDGTPIGLVAGAFDLKDPGDTDVVSPPDRVFLVTLDKIHKPDLTTDESRQVTETVAARIGQSLQEDMFEAFARAVQSARGVSVNQSAVDAVISGSR